MPIQIIAIRSLLIMSKNMKVYVLELRGLNVESMRIVIWIYNLNVLIGLMKKVSRKDVRTNPNAIKDTMKLTQ